MSPPFIFFPCSPGLNSPRISELLSNQRDHQIHHIIATSISAPISVALYSTTEDNPTIPLVIKTQNLIVVSGLCPQGQERCCRRGSGEVAPAQSHKPDDTAPSTPQCVSCSCRRVQAGRRCQKSAGNLQTSFHSQIQRSGGSSGVM